MMNRVFERMCHMLIQSIPTLAAILQANIPTTKRAIDRLMDLDIVTETTGQARTCLGLKLNICSQERSKIINTLLRAKIVWLVTHFWPLLPIRLKRH